MEIRIIKEFTLPFEVMLNAFNASFVYETKNHHTAMFEILVLSKCLEAWLSTKNKTFQHFLQTTEDT